MFPSFTAPPRPPSSVFSLSFINKKSLVSYKLKCIKEIFLHPLDRDIHGGFL